MLEGKFTAGEGKLAVTLEVKSVGGDVNAILTAGRAHIGAVALAMPCVMNSEGVNASVSVMTIPGHRDDIPAGRAALTICKATRRPVAVSAGLHIDGATKEEITALVKNSEAVVNKYLKITEGF